MVPGLVGGRDKSLADRLFDSHYAENELDELLAKAGVPHQGVGWDHYDCSIELYGVPVEYRLSEDAQRAIHGAGFVKAYMTHVDYWETHYTFRRESFSASAGWRVSYPHKRGADEKGIWVEKNVPGWPQEWFVSGYVIVKQ